MKRLFLFLALLPILANAGNRQYLGIYKADQHIAPEVWFSDSNGVRHGGTAIDSCHIITYLNQNAAAIAFSTRSTTYPFSAIGIDTLKQYGDTLLYFVDQIQDIDGTPSPSNAYSLSVRVTLWNMGIPDDNVFTLQVIPDSLHVYLARLDVANSVLRDSINVTHAEVQNIDAWNPITDNDSLVIHQSTARTALLTFLAGGVDSVQIDESTLGTLTGVTVPTVTTITNDVNLADADMGTIADSVLDNIITGHTTLNTVGALLLGLAGVQDSVRDSVINSSTVFSTALSTTNIYKGQAVVFTSGALAGEGRTIIDATANGSRMVLTVYPAFSDEPAATSRFAVLGSRNPRTGNTGYVGPDFNSLNGTLDASEVGNDLITKIADSIWLSLLADRDGVAGSFGDSAQGWGATAASSTDTTNIKTMMANNPHIVSGRQVMYWSTVKATPGTTGFSATGGNLDMAKLNDFYNWDEIVFFSGDLRGKPVRVVDWVTATDSFAIDVDWGVQTPIAPAIGDSFIIVGQPSVNVWSWSGNVLNEARQTGGAYNPQVDVEAVDGNATPATNLATAFGTGASWAGTNWTINSVTMLDSVKLAGSRKIATVVADTAYDRFGQALLASQGIAGKESDSSALVRYVSITGGSPYDGKSWATAWREADWVDSANAFWRNLQASANYDGMNVVYFAADSFMTAGKLCSLKAPNTWLIGAGEWGLGAPATKLYRRQTLATSPAASGDSDLVRILADNCHVINFTMNATDTAGDPDFGSGTGGNNAITFDSAWGLGRGVRGGEVAYCYFPYLNHKPIQANARGNARYVAYNIWIHDNIGLRPKKHFIDGFFRGALIENNYVIGPEYGNENPTGDHATGSAAFQLIGTNSDSLVGKSNVVRNNYIQQMDVGIALINTDSNIVQGNIINKPSSSAWTVTAGYGGNMFINNEVNHERPIRTYGLLTNGSFETWVGTSRTPIGWSAGVDSAAIGVRSIVHYDTPRTGGWNFLIRGDTTAAANQQGYVNTEPMRLARGRYWFSIWARGDTSSTPSPDTLDVILYKQKVGGDSVAITWDNKWLLGAASYTQVDTTFQINSEGAYYLSFLAGGGAGGTNVSNTVFLDDAQLFQFIGDTLITNIASSLDPNDSIFVKGGVIDSNRTEQGGIAGAAIPFVVYAIDTSGTDDTISIANLTLYDALGSPRDGGPTTSVGNLQFTVTSGTWTVAGAAIGYHFDDSSYSVTGIDTVALYGYDQTAGTPPVAKTCIVSVYVLNSDGSPAEGVTVNAYLARNNAVDSLGNPVLSQMQTDVTDADGLAQFTCIWSSYLIPETGWWFVSPETGNIRKKVTVPRQSTYTVDFSQ